MSRNNDSADEYIKEIVTSHRIQLFLRKFISEDPTKITPAFDPQYRISDIMHRRATHLDIKKM